MYAVRLGHGGEGRRGHGVQNSAETKWLQVQPADFDLTLFRIESLVRSSSDGVCGMCAFFDVQNPPVMCFYFESLKSGFLKVPLFVRDGNSLSWIGPCTWIRLDRVWVIYGCAVKESGLNRESDVTGACSS